MQESRTLWQAPLQALGHSFVHTLTISLSAAIVEPYDFDRVDVLMWGVQAVQGTFQYGLVVPLESFSWP